MLLLPALALAAEIAAGWGVGLDARLGSGAVYVGYGGGPSVSVGLSDHLDAHAEVRWLTLAGSTWLYRAGVAARARATGWRPGAGLDLALFHGASLRAITDENPTLAADVAGVVQARLSPLRWEGERGYAEALRVEAGAGLDRGALAPALGLTVVEAGLRW